MVRVHVNLEVDNGDDIEELPTPVEEQSRLLKSVQLNQSIPRGRRRKERHLVR